MFGVYNMPAMEGFNAILMGKKVEGYKTQFSYAELCSEEAPFTIPSLTGNQRGASRDTRRCPDDDKKGAPPSPLENAPLRGTRLPIFTKGRRYSALWRVPKSVASETTLFGMKAADHVTGGQHNDALTFGDVNDPEGGNGSLLQITPLSLQQFPSSGSIVRPRGALYKWRGHPVPEEQIKPPAPDECLNISMMRLQQTPPRCYTDKPPLPPSGVDGSKSNTAPAHRTTWLPKKPKRTRYFQGLTSSGAHFAFCAHIPTRARKKGRRPTLTIFAVYHIEVKGPSDINVRRQVKELFTVSEPTPLPELAPLPEFASPLDTATGESPDAPTDGGNFTLITAKKRIKRRCKFKNVFLGDRQIGDVNNALKPGKSKRSTQLLKKGASRNKSVEVVVPSSRQEPPGDVMVPLERAARNDHSKYSPNCKTVNTALNLKHTSKSTLGAVDALNNDSTVTTSDHKTSSPLKTSPTTNPKTKMSTNTTDSRSCRRQIRGVPNQTMLNVSANEKSQSSHNSTDKGLITPNLKTGTTQGVAGEDGTAAPECDRKRVAAMKKRYQIGRLRTDSRTVDTTGSSGREETGLTKKSVDSFFESPQTPGTSGGHSVANKCVTLVLEYDSDQNEDDVLDSTKLLNMAKVQCRRDVKRIVREEGQSKLWAEAGNDKRDKSRFPRHIVSMKKAGQVSNVKVSSSATEDNPRIFPKVRPDGKPGDNRNTNHDDTLLWQKNQDRIVSLLNGTDWIESDGDKDKEEETLRGGTAEMDDDDEMIDTVSQCNDPLSQCNDPFYNSQDFESDAEVTSQKSSSGLQEECDNQTGGTAVKGNSPRITNTLRVSDGVGRWDQKGSVSIGVIQADKSGVTRADDATSVNRGVVCANVTQESEKIDAAGHWAMPVKEIRSKDDSLQPATHHDLGAQILSIPCVTNTTAHELVSHVKCLDEVKTIKDDFSDHEAIDNDEFLIGVTCKDLEKMCDRGGLFPNLGRIEFQPSRGHLSNDRVQESADYGPPKKRVMFISRGASRRVSWERTVPSACHDSSGTCGQGEISKLNRSKDPTDGSSLTSGPVDSCSFQAKGDINKDQVHESDRLHEESSSPWTLLRKTVLPTVPARLPERRLLSQRRQVLRLKPNNTSSEQKDRLGASGDSQRRPGKARICVKGRGIVLESQSSDEYPPSPKISSGKCKGAGDSKLKSEGRKVADPCCEKCIRLPQLLGNGDTLESPSCSMQVQGPAGVPTEPCKTPQRIFKYSTDFLYCGKAKVDTWLKSAYH